MVVIVVWPLPIKKMALVEIMVFNQLCVGGGSSGLMRLQEAGLLKIIILCKRHVYIVIGPNTKLLLAIFLVIPLQNVVSYNRYRTSVT